MLAKGSKTFATIWFMALLPFVWVAGCCGECWWGIPEANAPTVIATVPADLATGVPINQIITAAFSEAMDPSSITTATFMVTGPDGTAVAGAVTYDETQEIATFTPASNLALDTRTYPKTGHLWSPYDSAC